MPIIDHFSKILHGGDYNPDQWLDRPEILDEDFKLMEKAHCNTFSVGIFSWGQLETEEGNFDFSWLDDIFDRAEKSGKKLFLATPSAAKPGWLAEKYPETNITGKSGTALPWHARQRSCLNSVVFREKAANIARKLAKRYAGRSALAGWHISNEYSTECFCPRCIAKYHDFLKKRYETLENLNRHYWSAFWSHRLTSWEQIDPRDQAVNVAVLDWKRFLTRLHADFFQMEIDAVREFSDLPVTTNMMGLYGVLDYWKIAEKCDFISDDCYPTWYPGITEEVASNFSALHDMHYTMKNKPFLMMESCPGTVNYKRYMRIRRPNEFQREMHMALGHGADGTMYFQWRKGQGNCEQLHGAVVGHDGSDRTMVFRDVSEYGSKLERISEIVDSKKEPETALILDWESRWCLDLAAGYSGEKGKRTDETVFQHYQALWRQNYEVAVIDSDQPFNRYKVIIAPMLYLLKDGVAEKMVKFTEDGGTLIMTYLSAYTDQSNRCWFGGNPGGPVLRKLFGVWSEDIDGLTEETKQTLQYNGTSYPVMDFAEIIHAEGAEIIAEYGAEFYAGTPAVTRNRSGHGSAYYIGARTGLDFLTQFYHNVLSENGIEPVLNGLPEAVRATRRQGKDADYYFLLNMSDAPVGVTLPRPMTDIWNGESNPKTEFEIPSSGSAILKENL